MDLSTGDKIPHSEIAEKSLLSTLLVDEDPHHEVFERLRADEFYKRQNAVIYDAMRHLYNENAEFDASSLGDTLKQRGELEAAGGFEYLSDLIGFNPDGAKSLERHVDTIRKTRTMRELMKAAKDIQQRTAEATPDEAEVILDQAEQKIFAVSEEANRGDVRSAGDILWETMEAIEERQQQDSLITGVPSGFHNLDNKTGGFTDGQFIIVAARPSMGKTALALNMAQNAAIQHDYHAVIFSMEMDEQDCIKRMIAAEGRVDLTKIRNGDLDNDEMRQISKAGGLINSSPIWIDDTPSQSAAQITAKSRRADKEVGVDLIMVDYLQLMGGGQGDRYQKVTEFSRQLKGLARELDVPVIALSQLNRSPDNRDDKRPKLSDLRETGAIEQDADLVAMLYREDYYKEESPDKSEAEVIVRKQRNGPTGFITLDFIGRYTLFQEQEERF